VSPRERAAAAHAAAEAAIHPRDKAAFRAAAAAWERIAGPGVPWSLEPLARDLRQLRIDVAIATGPFTPPQPPKAAPPVRETVTRVSTPAVDPVTIQF
jgi:hypothetical protein